MTMYVYIYNYIDMYNINITNYIQFVVSLKMGDEYISNHINTLSCGDSYVEKMMIDQWMEWFFSP